MQIPTSMRRALTGAAVAAVIAAGAAAGVSEAAGPGAAPPKTAPAAAPSGGVLAGVRTALDRLVAGGTITSAQAAAVQSQADAGSIDPKVLVDRGVVNDAQMRAVAAAIDQVKRAAAR